MQRPTPTSSRRRWALITGTTLAAGLLAATAPASAWDLWPAGSVEGSGRVAEESRPLADFSRLRIDGPFQVQVRTAPAPARAQVKSDDNLLPLIQTRVEGDTLIIAAADRRNLRSQLPMQVQVSVPALQTAVLRGSGQLSLVAPQGPSLEIKLEGSGDVRLTEARLGRLELALAGSGDVRAEGRADELEVSVAGSGDVRASGLLSRRAEVSIAGSGDVEVHAEERLEVSIAGSGDVRYGGQPRVSSSIAGSGSIRPR